MNQNPMRNISIEKVTLSLGTGTSGEKLEKALKLINKITKLKAVSTKTKKRIPTWGVRPGLEIGAMTTLRRKKAEEILPKLLKAVDNKISINKFDKSGNFSFGIPEYIYIDGVDYDASIGIIGLNVAVTLQKPGYRIKRRIIRRSKIPKKHLITKEEAVEYIKNKFNIQID